MDPHICKSHCVCILRIASRQNNFVCYCLQNESTKCTQSIKKVDVRTMKPENKLYLFFYQKDEVNEAAIAPDENTLNLCLKAGPLWGNWTWSLSMFLKIWLPKYPDQRSMCAKRVCYLRYQGHSGLVPYGDGDQKLIVDWKIPVCARLNIFFIYI